MNIRRANARNVSFRISLRWPIHIINPVDETKLSCYSSHRRSTTVSLETYPSIRIVQNPIKLTKEKVEFWIEFCNFAVRFKGTGKRAHIVAHDVSWARKCAGHKLKVVFPCCANGETFVGDTKCFRTKSETFFVSATNVERAGKRGNICVGNNMSATMCPRLPGP